MRWSSSRLTTISICPKSQLKKPNNVTDHLQSVIAARADSLGLSSYEISKRCDGSPNPEAVKRYLTGRCGLGSAYLSKICDVLGLSLTVKKSKKIV
jgi:hypothetical protein